MTISQRLRHIVADNQILIVLLAMVVGAIFPDLFQPLAPYSTPLLICIFFTSSLRLNMDELVGYAKDWRMLLLSNFVMLVFMPLAMWLPPAIFAPDWALPFLIVGAMPTGLTIALIADLFGGKTSLAMLISATTSLLAPIVVPLIFKLVIGQQIAIPVFQMFASLMLTIVLPFVAAMVVKSQAKAVIERHDLMWREISLIVFGLLIAAIVADTMHGTPIHLGWNEIGIVAVMVVYMGGVAWLAYAIAAWRTPAERITIALCMVYMNNTLALYIGNKFFHEQNVVPRLLIILTAVNALLPPIKWAAGRVIKTAKTKIQRPDTIAQPLI
jgi:BASS family bile acid:Na+ symporter